MCQAGLSYQPVIAGSAETKWKPKNKAAMSAYDSIRPDVPIIGCGVTGLKTALAAGSFIKEIRELIP